MKRKTVVLLFCFFTSLMCPTTNQNRFPDALPIIDEQEQEQPKPARQSEEKKAILAEELAALIATSAMPLRPNQEKFYRPKGTKQWLLLPPNHRKDATRYNYATVMYHQAIGTRNKKQEAEPEPAAIALLKTGQKITLRLTYPLNNTQIFLSKQNPVTFNRVIG